MSINRRQEEENRPALRNVGIPAARPEMQEVLPRTVRADLADRIIQIGPFIAVPSAGGRRKTGIFWNSVSARDAMAITSIARIICLIIPMFSDRGFGGKCYEYASDGSNAAEGERV